MYQETPLLGIPKVTLVVFIYSHNESFKITFL